MPDAAERTLTMMGVTPQKSSWTTLGAIRLTPGTTLGKISPLFPRIEHSVEELRKMADDFNHGAPSVPASTHTPQPAAPPAPVTPAPAAATPGTTAPGTAAPSTISIDDFMKVELRVAK